MHLTPINNQCLTCSHTLGKRWGDINEHKHIFFCANQVQHNYVYKMCSVNMFLGRPQSCWVLSIVCRTLPLSIRQAPGAPPEIFAMFKLLYTKAQNRVHINSRDWDRFPISSSICQALVALTALLTIWCPGFVIWFPKCALAATTWLIWSTLMTPSCSAHLQPTERRFRHIQ